MTDRPELWAALCTALHAVAKPLVEAGWQVFDEDEDEDPPYGASVFRDLRRNDEEIELELTEGRALVVWRPGLSADPDDPDPPLFTVEEGSPAACLAAFRAQGWLRH